MNIVKMIKTKDITKNKELMTSNIKEKARQ